MQLQPRCFISHGIVHGAPPILPAHGVIEIVVRDVAQRLGETCQDDVEGVDDVGKPCAVDTGLVFDVSQNGICGTYGSYQGLYVEVVLAGDNLSKALEQTPDISGPFSLLGTALEEDVVVGLAGGHLDECSGCSGRSGPREWWGHGCGCVVVIWVRVIWVWVIWVRVVWVRVMRIHLALVLLSFPHLVVIYFEVFLVVSCSGGTARL